MDVHDGGLVFLAGTPEHELLVIDWDTIAIYGREPIGRFGWVPIRSVPHPRALAATLRLRGSVVLRGRTLDPG